MRQTRKIRESEFSDGARNMAVDSAIAGAVGAGRQPATLRLYGWNPYCLSLGFGQRARDANTEALRQRGWDLVRRPTGGKAILHGDELTYCLCLPLDHPLASGDIVESYRRISVGLLRALDMLGLPASAKPAADNAFNEPAGPVCFVQPSHYEILVAGRKLIGSAQLRRKGVLLQHGTIPIGGDVARICDVLKFKSAREQEEQQARTRQRALTLSQALGREPSWAEVAAAVETGFVEAFGLDLQPGKLSDQEEAETEALLRDKFGNSVWTSKR